VWAECGRNTSKMPVFCALQRSQNKSRAYIWGRFLRRQRSQIRILPGAPAFLPLSSVSPIVTHPPCALYVGVSRSPGVLGKCFSRLPERNINRCGYSSPSLPCASLRRGSPSSDSYFSVPVPPRPTSIPMATRDLYAIICCAAFRSVDKDQSRWRLDRSTNCYGVMNVSLESEPAHTRPWSRTTI
jgi:hypothetical protein